MRVRQPHPVVGAKARWSTGVGTGKIRTSQPSVITARGETIETAVLIQGLPELPPDAPGLLWNAEDNIA